MENIIVTGNTEIIAKEYEGKRVVTFKDIDNEHKKNEGIARRNFGNNRKHFIEGIDYFKIPPMGKFYSLKISPKGLIVLTQSGYYKIVKSFNDELSWGIYQSLLDTYFNAHPQPAITTPAPSTEIATGDLPAELQMLEGLVNFAKSQYAQNKQFDERIRLLEQAKPKEVLVEQASPRQLATFKDFEPEEKYTTTAIAKAFGTNVRTLNKYLYSQGIIYPYKGGWTINKRNVPESCATIKTNYFAGRDGKKEEKAFTWWTHNGMLFLCGHLRLRGFVQSQSVEPYSRSASARNKTKKSKSKRKANKGV